MGVIVWLLASIVVAVLVVEALRRAPPLVGLVACALTAPVALAFRDDGVERPGAFAIAKLVAVALGGVYVQAMKATRASERPAWRAAGFALLALNIVEAVIAEAGEGKYANALAGALLVGAMAPPSAVGVVAVGARRELRYRTGDAWLAAYVVWNFAFVYGRGDPGEEGAYAAMAILHLAAPLVSCWGESERFIEGRVLVLTGVAALRVVAPYPPWLPLVPGWYSPPVLLALRVASVALALVAVADRVRRARAAIAPGTERAPA
jgi:hypothetical protein